MSMGDFGQNWRDAVGLSATYMRSDDKRKKRTVEELLYTRRLERWNTKDSQANLWFIGGIGSLQGDDNNGHDNIGNKLMLTLSVQFDYETTRVYLQGTARLYRAESINHNFLSARTGYDKTQPWFVLEARHMEGLSDKVEITPMLQLVNKRFFIEAGLNNAHDPRFNFMYLF